MTRPTQSFLAFIVLAMTACGGASQVAAQDMAATQTMQAALSIIATHDAFTPVTPTDVPTDTPTAEPPTDTPTITPTYTLTLTPTLTLTATATFSPFLNPDALNNYYVALETGGPVGCGDSLFPVWIGLLKTGDVAKDVRTVMDTLFGTGTMYVAGLYNPIYLSNIRVDTVTFTKSTGHVEIETSGTVVKGDDYCEWDRIRDQVNTTALKVPGVVSENIMFNGAPFNDQVSKDRRPKNP